MATENAAYPVVADPSIQWIPYPIVAMRGWEAEAIARVIGTIMAAGIGGGCVLAPIGGWIGKIFSAVCSIIGLSGAKDVFNALSQLYSKQPHYNIYTCYGFPLYNPFNAGVTVQPDQDCQ